MQHYLRLNNRTIKYSNTATALINCPNNSRKIATQ